ncbi:hypothetical protein ACEPAF_1730 [Sanghuangporus sanghuang]
MLVVSRLFTKPLSGKGKSNTWVRSTNNNGGTLKDTGIAAIERKRGREETYVADSQTVEGTSPNARRIRRKVATINEASSHGSNLRDAINSCRKAKADGGLSMLGQYGAKPKPADMRGFDSLLRLGIVSSGYLQEEKENEPAAQGSARSLMQRAHHKDKSFNGQIYGACAIMVLSTQRLFVGVQHKSPIRWGERRGLL